ncbi:MAG: hypothetical protein M3536_10805 [Actinomycetota bacterium]|nr:hypothetical protein [Actinomycetota bacterium]
MSAYREFIDEDDEVFRAEPYGSRSDEDAVIEFSRFPQGGEKPSRIVFYTKDAEKIIALIREASK